MNKPLDDLYLEWLYSQVADPGIRDPSFTYWKLLKQLFTKEFVWMIPNDDNRLQDGKDLRIEFFHEKEIDNVDPDWVNLGCSVLELMVGLSRRIAFEADGEPHYWFWRMMENVHLHQYNDSTHRYPRRHIDDVLERIMYRKYHPNGKGGFFPLKHPDEDQRNVELWYQLSAYVLELG